METFRGEYSTASLNGISGTIPIEKISGINAKIMNFTKTKLSILNLKDQNQLKTTYLCVLSDHNTGILLSSFKKID
jgi:hypothetical protein